MSLKERAQRLYGDLKTAAKHQTARATLYGTLALASIGALSGCGNPSAPEEPKNSPITVVQAEAPQTIQKGTEGTWKLQFRDSKDGLSRVTLDYTTPSGEHDFKKTITPKSNTWDTTFTNTLTQEGTATLEYGVTDNFQEGQKETKNGTLRTDVTKAPAVEYTITGEARNAANEEAIGLADAVLTHEQQEISSTETNEQGSFGLSVSQEEGTTKQYQLALSKAGYKTLEETLDINNDTDVGTLHLNPQDVLYTGTLDATTRENDSTFVTDEDLEAIIDFQDAKQDTIYLQSTDDDLRVRAETDGFWLVPNNDVERDLGYKIIARSNTAGVGEQAETLDVTPIPRKDITAINNVTDQPLTDAYLLIEDKDASTSTPGAVIDSLTTTDGQFTDVALPHKDSVWVRVAELKNGQAHSFEHRKKILVDGSNPLTIATINRDRRDIAGTKTGEYTLDEMVNKLRRVAIEIHGNAPYVPLNNDDPGNGGDFPGILHRPTEASNGISYDKLIVPDTVEYVQEGFISRMEDDIPVLVDEIYTNQIQPLMGANQTPIERVGYLKYDTNDRPKNTAVLLPDETMDNSFGLVAVKGKLPHVNTHTYTAIFTDPDNGGLSEKAKRQTIGQELTAGTIYLSKLSVDGILDKDESIAHDYTTRTTPSDYDRSIGWFVYEPTFPSGEKAGNITYVPSDWK